MAKRIDIATLRKMKSEYARGGVTVRELAEKYGCSFYTLRNRATREGWTDRRTEIEKKIDATVEAKMEQRAEAAVDRAKALVERTVEETAEWLDTIKGLRQQLQDGDYDGALKAVNAWARVIETGRNALGLDEKGTPPTGLIQQIVVLPAGHPRPDVKVLPYRPPGDEEPPAVPAV